jgi:hypothetical protein
MRTILRYLWAAPASGLGLVLAIVGIAAGGRLSLHTGVIEAEGRLLAWGLNNLTWLDRGAAAITFGHVVLARDTDSLEWTRTHERVHVRQYERWGRSSSRSTSRHRAGPWHAARTELTTRSNAKR